MTLLRELATFVTAADARDLPRLDREILRRHVVDVVVARIAGGRSQEGAALGKVFCAGGDSPEAVAYLAGLVRLTEMDDIHLGSTTTPSSVTVPVALGLAAHCDAAPHDIESAIYVGTELLVRFGKAMDGSRAIGKGFWPTRSAATLAACATAARIWGLGPDETHEALSLAATMTNGKTGRFHREPSGRWIVFAAAVASGIRCALAARSGFKGSASAPDANWIGSALGIEFDAHKLQHSLGQGSVYPELSLKPYGGARQCLSAAEAMMHLVVHGLDPASIARVTIRVPTEHVAMISQPLDPGVRASSFVSVAAQVATAAVSPSDLYDVERKNVLNGADILRLARLCEVVGDAELQKSLPEVWGASLEIVTNEGTVAKAVFEPVGSPGNRMTDAQCARKALGVLQCLGQGERAVEIASLCEKAFQADRPTKMLCQMMMSG